MAEDIYGTDLKMTSSDLAVSEGGDLDVITGTDNLNQSLMNGFLTAYYYWGGSHKHGSRLQEFVEGRNEATDVSDLKKAVVEVLRADARVTKDSWNIQIENYGETAKITVTYLPVGRSTPEIQTFLLE